MIPPALIISPPPGTVKTAWGNLYQIYFLSVLDFVLFIPFFAYLSLFPPPFSLFSICSPIIIFSPKNIWKNIYSCVKAYTNFISDKTKNISHLRS